MMFTKKEKVRKVAEVVVGFGILFVGLSTMSQAMANMKNEPQVVNLLMSLKNPFLATLMGFALTAIIQSSSVTVSIVLLLLIRICCRYLLRCTLSWDVISVPALPQC